MDCPNCKEPLDYIEVCESDDTARKTSYSCNKDYCPVGIVYIVEFFEEESDEEAE